MNIRTPLPNLRAGLTVPVAFKNQAFDVTYNFGEDGRIGEAFMRATKEGNDLSALLVDGCILISILCQHGMTMEQIATSLGEDRPEGAMSGPASSALGAIAREAAALELRGQT